MNRTTALGLLFALLLGAALRVPELDIRPMHNDEAVNAVKFGKLWEQHNYKYDPNEHHGPSLAYFTWLIEALTAAPDYVHISETRLRMVTVLFGLGLIPMLPLLSNALGRTAVSFSGLFIAASPAMVFYSRYYIHEMLLVFFTLLALGSGWRYWTSRKPGWALLTGAAAGLMQATKETFIITVGVAVLALALNQFWNRMLDATGAPVRAPVINWKHLAGGLVAWVLVAGLLFSSFLTNPRGIPDAFRTYAPWLNRAAGASPHIHPWSFYLRRLLFFHAPSGPVWSEGFIAVLAIVGAWAAFARKRFGEANLSFVRFLTLFAFGLTAAYSLIGYKTPWCLLNFWLGALLLAGAGAVVILSCAKRPLARTALGLVILAGTAQLAGQAWQAASEFAADRRNPYVYAQTSPDILKLVRKIESLETAWPEGHRMPIKVMAPEGDYWPLPWYLRDFPNTGWWESPPENPFAPVMIVSAQFHAGYDEKKTHLMVQYFELRPQVFFELYVELGLWQNWLAKNPPKPD